jgi:uncharacterized protein (TIGR03083 family)
MRLNRSAALRRQSADVIRFCRDLGEDEWGRPSAAEGWRIKDVVAHLGASCHAIFTPASVTLLYSKNIERTNDFYVDQRRDWRPERVLAEFERWSRRLAALSGALSRTPARNVRLPLGELGKYPAQVLLGSAVVFDQHTHLRYDLAPALDRPTPRIDEERTAVVLEWMLAVLSNQLRKAGPPSLDRPVSLTLTGPGGGSWVVAADGRIQPGAPDGAAAIVGGAEDFPGWGTGRTPWRDADIKITGDEDYAVRFLDALNIV